MRGRHSQNAKFVKFGIHLAFLLTYAGEDNAPRVRERERNIKRKRESESKKKRDRKISSKREKETETEFLFKQFC